MGKVIGLSYKYNRSKISTPTLKKHVLSSSAHHTSYTTTSTRTIISYQLEHKDSTSIQNTSNISNTDDIHSYATPQKQNISVKATSTPPCLTLATSIKTDVRTLPTYRWHPLIYTKYHLILQKYNKNNNEEYLILMYNETVSWFSMGGGDTLVGNGVVVGCVGVGWYIKKCTVVCETWTSHQSTSIAHYYLVNLEKYLVYIYQLYHFMKIINLSRVGILPPL